MSNKRKKKRRNKRVRSSSQTSNRPKDGKVNLRCGNYLVAALDLMGQSEALKELRGINSVEAEREKIEEIGKKTVGRVEIVREWFQGLYETFKSERSLEHLSFQSEEQKRQFAKLRKVSGLKFQPYSDSSITSVALGPDPLVAMNSVSAVFKACVITMLYGLAMNFPMRGGMEAGVAWETSYGDIYGFPVSEVYRLESKEADHMQILIGEELFQYLIDMSQLPGVDDDTLTIKALAITSLELISEDADGNKYLDFMGEGVLRIFQSTTVLTDMQSDLIPRIRRYLTTSLEEITGDVPNAERKREIYQRTLDYYDNRKDLWQL